MSKHGRGAPPLLAILPRHWPAPLSSKWARAPRAPLKFQDAAESKISRSKELQYDSVVVVKYMCIFVGADCVEKAQAALGALSREA